MKKDLNQTPYELWYGHKSNVSYLKLFGSKQYILKESRKGKFDVKCDEGIFLGYSCKIKTYKCLNFSTYKTIESAHVRIDKFVDKREEECNKELEDYRIFYYYEPDTFPNLSRIQEASPPESPKSPIATELQLVKPESQSKGPESQSEDINMLLEKVKSNGPKSQIVGFELNIEDHQEVNETKSKSKVPMLARCVIRHHALDQIIGDKSDGTIIRNKLKGTCLLVELEPRNVKDALDNKIWIEVMNEEIKKIEKEKTWTLVCRSKEKCNWHKVGIQN